MGRRDAQEENGKNCVILITQLEQLNDEDQNEVGKFKSRKSSLSSAENGVRLWPEILEISESHHTKHPVKLPMKQ